MNQINENSFESMCLKCVILVCTCDLRWLHHWTIAESCSKSNQVCI